MDKTDLFNAIRSLKEGNVVVYPTDTLYALGADVFNKKAVEKVFRLKNRPLSDPIPVAVSSYSELDKIAFADKLVKRLYDSFLPGPLTLVLDKKHYVSDLVTGGLDKIAVRIPDNEVALSLLHDFGPLTVTSANLHGKIPPHTIADIRDQLSLDEDTVCLYVGVLNKKASTIVDLTSEKPSLIREGEIKMDEISRVIKNL